MIKNNKLCQVYRKCGACSFLDKPYNWQIAKKQKLLVQLFKAHKILPIIEDPFPLHYRHKIYATFGQNKQGIFLGLYAANSHLLLPSKDCLIQHQKGNDILATLTKLANDFHLSIYQEDKRKGLLRHVYIRISAKNAKVMLVLVIGQKEFIGVRNFMKVLLAKHPEIETIILNYNNRQTSQVLGERNKVVYGKGYLIDEIDGLLFRISAQSFYQINPHQAYKLYKKAIDLAGLKKEMTVIDACSGTGTISLLLSRYVSLVIGIELNRQAVYDANENRKLNNIHNVHFWQGRVEEIMPKQRIKADVLFLDPPRSGLGQDFMHFLDDMKIPKIVYISCNPHSQAIDMQALLGHYNIMVSQGVDMFPQTESIENIIVLQRKSFKYHK